MQSGCSADAARIVHSRDGAQGGGQEGRCLGKVKAGISNACGTGHGKQLAELPGGAPGQISRAARADGDPGRVSRLYLPGSAPGSAPRQRSRAGLPGGAPGRATWKARRPQASRVMVNRKALRKKWSRNCLRPSWKVASRPAAGGDAAMGCGDGMGCGGGDAAMGCRDGMRRTEVRRLDAAVGCGDGMRPWDAAGGDEATGCGAGMRRWDAALLSKDPEIYGRGGLRREKGVKIGVRVLGLGDGGTEGRRDGGRVRRWDPETQRCAGKG